MPGNLTLSFGALQKVCNNRPVLSNQEHDTIELTRIPLMKLSMSAISLTRADESKLLSVDCLHSRKILVKTRPDNYKRSILATAKKSASKARAGGFDVE